MIFNGKEHTFVIYNGKVTTPQALLRKLLLGHAVTLEAPAAVLTRSEYPAGTQPVSLVLSDGTEYKLTNATINGSTVELAAL